MKDSLTNFAQRIDYVTDASGKTDNGFEGDIKNIINAVIGVLGIVAVIVIIIGGVSYMTSSGDAGKVKKAKDIILYGVIGLIICALAFAIVNFVIGNISNSGTSSTSTIITTAEDCSSRQGQYNISTGECTYTVK